MNKIILIPLCLVLFCCSKNDDDTIDNQKLQNTIWIDAKTGTDTLRFTEDLLLRGPRDYSGQQMDLCGHPYWGIYSYSLKNNLLLLDWEGAEKIYFIKPFEYKISICDNTLIINNFIDCYYPREKFQTDTFLLIASNCSKEFIEGYLVLDNKLVGKWGELSPCESCKNYYIFSHNSITFANQHYETDYFNKEASYAFINGDSIQVTRNYEIELSRKITKHKVVFLSSDTIRIEQFRAVDYGITGFEDVTLTKME